MFLVSETGLVILGIILLAIIILLAMSFKVIRQSNTGIVERLGKYIKTLDNGFHVIIPFFDRVVHVISMKERVCDFKPQPVITKDNVTMQIDTVVYFQVTDPKLFTYGVERPVNAIENLTATTLRNIIGELELDQTLTSRDTINTKMRLILDEATDPWGIKVTRVELKNIIPPREIQDAMEKQMRAERERRESILKAEGDKQSNILIAEGEKTAAILRAEAEKAKTIKDAEGKAEAFRLVYEAQERAIEVNKNAKPSAEYIKLESYKAMEKVADGNATKIIVPSELQNITSVTTAIAETLKTTKEGI